MTDPPIDPSTGQPILPEADDPLPPTDFAEERREDTEDPASEQHQESDDELSDDPGFVTENG